MATKRHKDKTLAQPRVYIPPRRKASPGSLVRLQFARAGLHGVPADRNAERELRLLLAVERYLRNGDARVKDALDKLDRLREA